MPNMLVRIFFILPFLTAGASAGASSQVAFEEETPEILFVLPIDCIPGETCYVQNYVDVEPNRRWRDYMCRGMTYDRHKGTDFRIPSRREMDAGVSVFAAADGRVKGIRRSEEDGLFINGDKQAVEGKECGNGIIIAHENGWETQYCHLKQNSIRVSRGQKVTSGMAIASVGLSGATEFTHLHFEVRHNGNTIDPFTGATTLEGCNVSALSHWDISARAFLNYIPSGVLNQGVATDIPDNMAIESGQYSSLQFETDAPSLIYFVRIFGLRPGDIQELSLTDPQGAELAHNSAAHKGPHKAQFFSYIGKKRPEGGWPEGAYTVQYNLIRNGQTLLQRDLTFNVGETLWESQDNDE